MAGSWPTQLTLLAVLTPETSTAIPGAYITQAQEPSAQTWLLGLNQGSDYLYSKETLKL